MLVEFPSSMYKVIEADDPRAASMPRVVHVCKRFIKHSTQTCSPEIGWSRPLAGSRDGVRVTESVDHHQSHELLLSQRRRALALPLRARRAALSVCIIPTSKPAVLCTRLGSITNSKLFDRRSSIPRGHSRIPFVSSGLILRHPTSDAGSHLAVGAHTVGKYSSAG